MRSVSVTAMALALIMSSTSFASAPALLGDLDDDDLFTANDLAKLVGHSSGTAPLPTTFQPFADLNQDGFINDADHDALVSLILESSSPQNLPLASVREVSPAKGEGDVAVTRETVVHFSMPLALSAALDTTQFYAEFGARKMLSRVEISSDRKKATLFYLEPLPSNARIQITLAPTTLNDLVGRPVDLDGDGQAGGTYTTSFDTLSITPVAGTAISGRVFASEPGQGAGGVTVDVPLAGVTVTVDGAEETLRTITDAQGNFTLNPSPAGSFFIHVDGRTSPQSAYPNGNYYPSVGKRWEALAGRTDNLSGNSEDTSRGTIYLPKILANALETVSQSQDTKVDFPPAILADNPELAGTELDVPANSLFADDGTRGGRVGIAPVAPDRLPSPLPPGLNLPMVITIQTDGATNFDRPVPICFPNLPDPVTGEKLPPGAKSALWSFNHDLGDWEIIGPMTVTEDGNFVKTDAGVGVRQPGWHGSSPGSRGAGRTGGGLGSCTPSIARVLELVYDIGSEAADCASEFGKVAKAIECLIEIARIIPTTLKVAREAVAVLDADTPSVDRVLGILSILKTEKTRIEVLVDKCNEAAGAVDPFSKATAIFNCIGNALNVASGICDLVEEVGEKPSCQPSFLTKNVCKGLEAAQLLHAYVKTYVDLAEAARKGVARDVALALLSQSIKKAEILLQAMQLSASSQKQKALLSKDGSSLRQLSLPERDKLRRAFSEILGAAETAERIFNTASKANSEIQGVYSQVNSLNAAISAEMVRTSEIVIDEVWHLLSVDGQVTRSFMAANTTFNPILAPDSQVIHAVYDHKGRRYSKNSTLSSSAGLVTNLPFSMLRPLGRDALDGDSDGIPNVGEEVIGTNPMNADTDGDGVNDGAELDAGTNPLDGFIAQTGVIASAPTTRPALDVSAQNNLAAVACGDGGVSIFNVLRGLNPLRLAEIDTPGYAQAVSCAGNYVAVADGLAGLAVVDLSDPTNVRQTQQIPLGGAVVSVATDGLTCFVGLDNGQIVSVDLPTGTILSRVSTGAGMVHDLGISGSLVYALKGLTLLTFQYDGYGGLSQVHSLSRTGQLPPSRRPRLFVGSGFAFGSLMKGYTIFDLANPALPTHRQQIDTSSFGWKHIVANGSGSGLACVGANASNDGEHDVSLYDIGANGFASTFSSTFNTPGIAEAISIYNGLAYVADGAAGLQVVSYRPFDNQGQAPTVALSASITLDSVARTGSAVSGQTIRWVAQASDDLQVAAVEFLVDGQTATVDGNYPFELTLPAPVRTTEKTSFSVEAVARDTGGNVGRTQVFTISLTTDTVAPTVIGTQPTLNGIVSATPTITARFSKPMVEQSLLSAAMFLTFAGADGALDTIDDALISTVPSYRANLRTAFLNLSGPLTPGLYRLTVQNPAADTAGNVMTTPHQVSFRVFSTADLDGDGIPDELEPSLGLNPTKLDSNNNGKADGAEDFDGDGLANAGEIRAGTDPRVADTNGNGIPDGQEDSDADGLTDQQEYLAGTDPRNRDTDGDGWIDEVEVSAGSNPLIASSLPKFPAFSTAGAIQFAVPQQPNYAEEAKAFGATTSNGQNILIGVPLQPDYLEQAKAFGATTTNGQNILFAVPQPSNYVEAAKAFGSSHSVIPGNVKIEPTPTGP